MKKDTAKDFESALASLEQKVKLLESGDLPLEESLRVFEEGMAVAAFCRSKLGEAEQKVEILLKGKDGSVRAEPFVPDGVSETADGRSPALLADDEVPF